MKKSTFFLLFALLLGLPAQAQTFRTDAPIDEALAGFGGSVALDGGTIYVGEPQNTVTPGFVYAYTYDAEQGAWAEHARLSASDASDGDRFGESLAVDGATLAASTTSADSSRGAVYVFGQKDGMGAWMEQARLSGSDAQPEDGFGTTLALRGDVLAVGAPMQAGRTGAVYLFRRDAKTGSWQQEAKLTGSIAGADARFGSSLALAGDVLVIGAPRHAQGAGGVFVFRTHDGAWHEDTTLSGNEVKAGHRFGSAVALSGDHLLVGAPMADGAIGAAYTFHHHDGTWMQQAHLTPTDAENQTRFGMSVALDGPTAWVGAPGANTFAGAAYVYQQQDGTWTQTGQVAAANGTSREFFAGTLALQGSWAVAGVLGADYGAGTAIVFEQQDGAWTQQATLASTQDSMAPVVEQEMSCIDGKVNGFDCGSVDLVAFLPVRELGGARGVRVNDIWGWTDPETGKEYALVGRVDGTSFVDLSDPYHPVYLGNLPKTAASPGSVWRDVKTYANHAFIVADGAGAHGMQVFDLTQLRDVQNPPVTFSETAHYDQIHSAHNIVINEATGYAYSVGSSSGGETCGGGLHMINIQDPANPTFAGCFADSSTGRASTGYSHDAQCVIYSGPDAEHQGKEICLGANETALSIADVTDKENPVALSRASYPNVGYSHQGWLTEDQRYFYMNDELDELSGTTQGTRTLVWDISDLDDPQLIKEHFSEQQASDHNLYIRGHLMYQSNYKSGLRILDISEPANPVEVGFFDTVPYGDNSPGFGGSWSNYPFFKSGVIVVTSMSEGLFLLKKTDVDI